MANISGDPRWRFPDAPLFYDEALAQRRAARFQHAGHISITSA
jgi:hypothetical protein